jgi:hypothetical protein
VRWRTADSAWLYVVYDPGWAGTQSLEADFGRSRIPKENATLPRERPTRGTCDDITGASLQTPTRRRPAKAARWGWESSPPSQPRGKAGRIPRISGRPDPDPSDHRSVGARTPAGSTDCCISRTRLRRSTVSDDRCPQAIVAPYSAQCLHCCGRSERLNQVVGPVPPAGTWVLWESSLP